MMTLEQLEYLLAYYGASYVSDSTGAVHFDAPVPLPPHVMDAVLRLTPELARRCLAQPVLNAPPAERRLTAAGRAN